MIERPINESELTALWALLKRASGLTPEMPPGFRAEDHGHFVDLIGLAALRTQHVPPGARPKGSRLSAADEKAMVLLLERATGVKVPLPHSNQDWAAALAVTVGHAHGLRMTEYLSKHKHPV